MSALRSLIAGCLALGLAACAGGPIEEQPPLSRPEITRGAVSGAAGVALHLTTWTAETRPRAVILALHGYGDTGEQTFYRAARHWAGQGITTYAYDQRGFGFNDSYRRWPGHETLIADLLTVTARLRAHHPDLPLTVIGHSMGGGVVLAAAARDLQADRIILAGPAITGGQEVNPAYRLVGWGAGVLMPEKRFTGDGIVRIVPTDNYDAMVEAFENPRKIADPSARELYGLIRLMDAAEATTHRVTLPTLTLMGARDQIFPPRQIKRVHDRIPGDNDFILYPEGWHWLFRDLQAEAVWKDVAAFALEPRQAP